MAVICVEIVLIYGVFISNFVGAEAFAAVNFIMPFLMLLGAAGFMVGTGGSALVPFMLQNAFQSFLITAERPHFGLIITVAAGAANIVLDALFIAVFRWGVAGAAFATCLSQFIGGIIPLIYFIFPNNSKLRLCGTRIDLKILIKTCIDGSSEFMTNISMSVVNMMYNWQLMRLAGSEGVAIYGVIMCM